MTILELVIQLKHLGLEFRLFVTHHAKHLQNFLFWTEHHSQMVSTPASDTGDPGFSFGLETSYPD
jgi:hypothetical protein